MEWMFNNCNSLRILDLSMFDTKKVINMSNMFGSCSSLNKLNLSSFHTRPETNVIGIFDECKSLNSKRIICIDEKILNEVPANENCFIIWFLDNISFI